MGLTSIHDNNWKLKGIVISESPLGGGGILGGT